MCVNMLLMAALSMLTHQSQQQSLQPQLPDPDAYNRYLTRNQHGYSDPTTNIVIDRFVLFSKERTPHLGSRRPEIRQPYVLEAGGAYGFVTERVLRGGGHVLFNDLSEEHVQIAEDRLPENLVDGQFLSYPGRFPDEVENFADLRQRKIVGVGLFMWLHFLRGQELEHLFWILNHLLEPGAEIFITAASPYNRILKGIPTLYKKREKHFFKSPAGAYPGEIEDAWKYLPQDKYPPFLHVLTPKVLSFAAKRGSDGELGVVETFAIERPNPPSQAYRRGYAKGETEISGIILRKRQHSDAIGDALMQNATRP